VRRLRKLDPLVEDPVEQVADLEYYRSLDTATRFRLIIERSVLLLRLGKQRGVDRDRRLLVKRR